MLLVCVSIVVFQCEVMRVDIFQCGFMFMCVSRTDPSCLPHGGQVRLLWYMVCAQASAC